MTALHVFRCMVDHQENKRWGQGCGFVFAGRPGPQACPNCGAVYVLRIK